MQRLLLNVWNYLKQIMAEVNEFYDSMDEEEVL